RRDQQGSGDQVMMLRSLFVCLSLLVLSFAPGAAQAQTSTPVAEYKLGAGDVVRVSVYQNPDLAQETRVNEVGELNFPLLGVVKVGGLSVTAAERAIAEGLKSGNFVRNPQVTLIVTQVRAHLANVLGQVGRPGRYALETAGMRLSDLLSMAGGANTM